MEYIIGIDIGGTKIAVSLAREASEQIRILDKICFATPKEGYEAAIVLIFDNCYKLLDNNGISIKNVAAIGISCGGPLDAEAGVIQSPPNLPGWDEVAVCELFEKEFQVPVFLENDANACALAEFRFGAGRGKTNMIFLTFGTGFGAGLILDKKLYRGTNGMAGEIGHCSSFWQGGGDIYSPVGYGRAGSFEGFCSGNGIAELGRAMALQQIQQGKQVSFCRDMGQLSRITARSIAEAAYKGDELARKIYRISGEQLGAAAALLVDILNPELIVIGSIYARSRDLLEGFAARVLGEQSIPVSASVCKIVPAALGENLADIGAVSTAISGLLEREQRKRYFTK